MIFFLQDGSLLLVRGSHPSNGSGNPPLPLAGVFVPNEHIQVRHVSVMHLLIVSLAQVHPVHIFPELDLF